MSGILTINMALIEGYSQLFSHTPQYTLSLYHNMAYCANTV